MNARLRTKLERAYRLLLAAYGPQHWWPGESPLEVVVGAVLVQNTAWKNVQRAIENLRAAQVMRLPQLLQVDIDTLAELVRPAGYYRMKARRLKNLLDSLEQDFGGKLEPLFALETAAMRDWLLRVNGVGPETADSIVLYAAERPAFVVDTYTRRVAIRHGWIEPPAKYDALQTLFVHALPVDVPLWNEYHALLVRVGHLHCGTTPKCEGCPLAGALPRRGPVSWP